MGYLKYKGYTGSVEYSEDDKCLFGKVQGILTPEIHSGVAIAAQNAGITINAFIKNAVAKALGIVL